MPLLLFSFGLQLHDALAILTWTQNKSTLHHLQIHVLLIFPISGMRTTT